MLQQIWAETFPETPYARTSPRWKEMGFQQNDPATDLRSLGVSALEAILYFASKHKAEYRRLLQNCTRENWYPFAVGCINILKGVLDHVEVVVFEGTVDQGESQKNNLFEIFGFFSFLFWGF